jgi:hypothetical protein
MFNLPTLGGFNPKLAEAYLLPPAKPVKKKKQPKPTREEKVAALADAIVREQTQNTLFHLSSYDFMAGWQK